MNILAKSDNQISAGSKIAPIRIDCNAFYLKNIGAKAKSLSPDQVRMIRELWAKRRSIAEIAEAVGALNETQVKNVIAGRTYQRIR